MSDIHTTGFNLQISTEVVQPDDLLDFALRTLASEENSEASARRAVSAAYYALLHTIAQAGASLFAGSPEQRQRIARAYNHNALVKSAKKIDSASRQKDSAARPDDGLSKVAKAFIELHQAREAADYDLFRDVDWLDADRLIWKAFHECRRFQNLRTEPATIDFLLDPLFPERVRSG